MALGKKSSEAQSGSTCPEPWRYKSAGFASRLCSTASWLAVSTATFAALTVPRRKEWLDICLDYMYTKRVQYDPTIYGRMFRFFSKVPK